MGPVLSTSLYLHEDLSHLCCRVWGARVVEPPEKDDQLVGLLPVLKSKLTVTIEKSPGAKAWVETEDILARVRSPQQGPEPDHDHLYHPLPEEAQGEERHWLWAMLFHQVLQGPEKDQDHIYHPVGGFREP
ncbi:proline-rich acidic protein 1 [Tupaia chinensis]|uniref:proline-rich acidic protein 1 n=1 Tax=Tupaia chinensis TaxID=246437 RepID=UPI000FFC6F0C|nr:proline-rich acidic protein 1 [Tupaia chinensis]XP_027627043.1 proline-rich acidic protein 1 [Tupaia chinensis]